MSGIFGGRPKRDKAAEAMQTRLRQEEVRRRSELEEDKSRISGGTGRKGRAQLRSKRSGLKTALGVS